MIQIYGASDDLIEVEGDVSEEFSAFSDGEDDKQYVACSDGTLLSVWYDHDGLWRFAPVFKGTLFLRIDQGSVSEDKGDVVHLGSENSTNPRIRWVALAKEYAK